VHSLSELNNYSEQSITTLDTRPTSIRYLFTPTVNKTLTINEDETHLAQLGTDIVEFVNCSTSDVVYSINVAGLANTTVTWTSLPANVTSNVSAGVYSVYGVNLVKQWDQIKSPTITLPTNYNGIFTYTSQIKLAGNVDASWTTTLTVSENLELSNPGAFFYTTGVAQTVIGKPIVQDNVGNAFTLITQPSVASYVSNLTVSGTGGTVTTNATTKSVTITSANKDQLNNYLANLTLTTAESIDFDFNLNYSLFNQTNSTWANVSQDLYSPATAANTLTRPNAIYYVQDTITSLVETPLINSIIDPAADFLLSISPTTANSISNLYTTSTFSNVNWYSGNVTLEMYGTQANINQDLGNLFLVPFSGLDQDFVLNYNLKYTSSSISSRNQDILINNITDVTANIAQPRPFVQNTIGLLFTENIPSIIDSAGNYTINFTSASGEFGINDNETTSNYSFTGTREECNSHFSLIKFYPLRDVRGQQTFTYSQTLEGGTEYSVVVLLVGSIRTEPYPDTTYTFTSSQLFTPTYEEARYLNKDILIVGGGGGGSMAGGGGGAGQVIEYIALTVNWNVSANAITIGTGGLGSTSLGNPGNFGSNTSAFGYTAIRGSGGSITGNGGASGSGLAGGTTTESFNDGTGRVFYFGGGGGGAGTAGENNTFNVGGGAGGDGIYSNLLERYYGGGGGGGTGARAVNEGGLGGGGDGASTFPGLVVSAESAEASTGSGGGGGGLPGSGGNGANGLVVIRFYR
jgi:hypothetical protein